MSGLHFDITGDNSNFMRKLDETKRGVIETSNLIEKEGASIEDMFRRMAKAAAGFGVAFSAKEFISKVASVRGEFQQLEVAFTTMLGSADKADALMQQLIHTAAITPFGLTDVSNGAKQLLAYGIASEDVNSSLIKLGDIAAGLSLPLNDLVYLYGTTITQGRMFTADLRQFQGRGIPLADELAKQFGVAKSEVGDLVTAGRVGAKEFIAAIDSMAGAGGKFGGLMEAQSKTITGQISNIEDAIETMFNDIGKANEGLINEALSGVSYLVENYEKVGEVIMVAATAYGTYKAALMSVAAYQRVATGLAYSAEIAELQKIIPLKEAESKTDLQQAASSGRLAEAKAAQIAAMRVEAAVHVESLQLKAAEATANYNAATSAAAMAALELEAAQVEVVACEMRYNAAIKSGSAIAIETAETQLGIAVSSEYSASKALAAARSEVKAAADIKSAASTAADTASTQLNTVSQVSNTRATNILTIAKTKLAAASKALGLSMLTNPYVLAAAAVAGLAFGIYKLVTAETAAEAAQKGYNNELERFNKVLDERKNRITELINNIKSDSSTDLSKQLDYDELSQIAPILTEMYTKEQLVKEGMSDLNKEIGKLGEVETEENIKKHVANLQEIIKQLDSPHSPYNTSGKDDAIKRLKEEGVDGSSFWGYADHMEAAQNVLNSYLKDLKKINDARKALEKPTELSVKVAKEDYEQSRLMLQYMSDFALAKKNEIEGDDIKIPFSTDGAKAERGTDEVVKEIEGRIKSIDEESTKIPLSADKLKLREDLQEVLGYIQQWKQNGWDNGTFTIPIHFSMKMSKLEEETNSKGKFFNYVTGQYEELTKKTKSFVENQKAAAKAWKDAESVYETAKKSKELKDTDGNVITNTDDQKKHLQELKDAAKAAKETAEALGIDTSGKSSKKTLDEAERLRKQKDKLNELELKQDREHARQMEDLLMQIEQANIDSKEDGARKTLAQMELNHEKELQQLDRQIEDYLEKKRSEAKAIFDAQEEMREAQNSSYKKETFDDSKIVLSETEIEHFNNWYKAILAKQKKDKDEMSRLELESMRDYLKEYGTFQEQKLAIAEEYAEKISKAQNKWEKQKLEKERDSTIQKKEIEVLKADIDWQTVFGNLGGMFKDAIKPVLEKAERYTKTDAFKNADHADQKALIDAIDQMKKSLSGAGTLNFKKLGQDVQAYQASQRALALATDEEANAKEKLKKATEAYHKALKEGTEEEKIAAKDAVEKAELNSNAASANVRTQTDTMNQAQEGVSDTANSLKIGMDDVTEGLSKLASGGLRNAYDGLKQIAGTMGGVIGKVADDLKTVPIVGWILSIIDILKDGLSNLVGGLLDAVFQAVEGIIGDVLSGDLFVTIGQSLAEGIRGIFDAITFGGFSSWVGIRGNAKEVNETIDKLTDSNKYLTAAIDKLTSEMEKSGGAKATSLYAAAYEKEKQKIENDRQMLAAKMGYWSSHHSNDYYINDAFSAKDWKKASDYVGKQLKSAGDLWKLSPQDLAKLQELPDIWEKINKGKYDQSKWLDAYIADAEKLEELTRQWQETMTQTSFDSFYSSFLDTLMDMDSSAEDFANNFEEYLRRSIFNAMLADEFDEDIRNLWKDWTTAYENDSKIDEDEAEALRERQKKLSEEMIAKRDKLMETFGWSSDSSSSQDSTKRGFETMTQDQAGELNGRFTALQMAGEELKNQMITLNQVTASLLGVNQDGFNSLINLHIQSNGYLEDISKHTKDIREMKSIMSECLKALQKI